jgi:thiol-disulfide isomerase/thioredoxin
LSPFAVAEPFVDFLIDGFDTAQIRQSKPLLIVIWRTGCSTCRLAMPFFDRLAAAYPDACILGVCQETRETLDAYTSANQIAFPQAADQDLAVTRIYQVQAVPTYFLTDVSGRIVASGVSWNREGLEEISATIAAMLNAPRQVLVRDEDGVPAFKPG